MHYNNATDRLESIEDTYELDETMMLANLYAEEVAELMCVVVHASM
jgi:hypothetical protein